MKTHTVTGENIKFKHRHKVVCTYFRLVIIRNLKVETGKTE